MLRIREEQLEEMAKNRGMAVEDLIVRVKEAPPPVQPRGTGLHIREEQMRAMAADMRERFIAKTVLLLEEGVSGWGQDKSSEEKEQFVRFMMEFAGSNKVFKEINVQKLSVWYLEFGFTIPLSDYFASILNKEGLPENDRIERFYEAIKSPTGLIEISLTDEL
jgi:hypothetical protein